MSTNTPDQQITMPVDGDSADNPVAFVNTVADIEQRLVRIYTDLADRTARMLTVQEGNLSALQDTGRLEWYNGTTDVSAHYHSLFSSTRTTTTQDLEPTGTTLQNLTNMVATLPGTAGAIFQFRGLVFYDATTTSDIRLAFTIPAAATIVWGGSGLATTTSGTAGDTVRATAAASAAPLLFGGAGAGTELWMDFQGEVTMGATPGDLQMQGAQGTSVASACVVHARSRLEVWRIS